MNRRIEIQPAPRGMARVETFVGTWRTGMSETMPLAAARLRAESMAGAATVIVDHTATQFAPVTNRPVRFQ